MGTNLSLLNGWVLKVPVFNFMMNFGCYLKTATKFQQSVGLRFLICISIG